MWKSIVCIVLAGLSNNGWAGPFDPIANKAWVGESVPGQTSATLQMNLTTVKAVKLISVTSPIAETVEIHNLQLTKGAMKVKVVPHLQLPDHQTTIIGTKGIFFMLTGLKQPLKIGEHIPVSLAFEFTDKTIKTISVLAEVKKAELSYRNYSNKGIYEDPHQR